MQLPVDPLVPGLFLSPWAQSSELAGDATAAWSQVVRAFGAEDAPVAVRPDTVAPHLARALTAWASEAQRQDLAVDVQRFDPGALWPGLAPLAAAALAAEVLPMVRGFAEAVGSPRLRIAFGPVRTTQCPKWHIDYIRMRVLRTYVGPGTEWVAPADVDPEAARHRPECDCSRSLLRPGAPIQRAESGAWLLLKGRLHFTERPGAVHRSPALHPRDPARVVLVVNTVD